MANGIRPLTSALLFCKTVIYQTDCAKLSPEVESKMRTCNSDGESFDFLLLCGESDGTKCKQDGEFRLIDRGPTPTTSTMQWQKCEAPISFVAWPFHLNDNNATGPFFCLGRDGRETSASVFFCKKSVDAHGDTVLNNWKIATLTIGILLMVAAICLGAFYVWRRRHQPPTTVVNQTISLENLPTQAIILQSDQSRLVPTNLTIQQLVASEADPVPGFCRKFAIFLETEGVKMEGTYRVDAESVEVGLFEDALLRNPDASLFEMNPPVPVVTMAFKRFFRATADPIIPLEFYDDIKEIMSLNNIDSQKESVHCSMRSLPAEHICILRFIVDHLQRMAQHQSVTRMGHQNLARVWATTLIRKSYTDLVSFTSERSSYEAFIKLLLDFRDVLFWAD